MRKYFTLLAVILLNLVSNAQTLQSPNKQLQLRFELKDSIPYYSLEYKNIPVVIVTTSSNKVDIEICTRLGASLYLVKPDSHAAWQQIVKQFVPYIS